MRILIDTNVPMYAWGGDHQQKVPCISVLGLVNSNPQLFITDAEVLQEILHRYKSQHVWDQMAERLTVFADLLQGSVEPVFAEDVLQAGKMAYRYPRLSARDLIHAAVAIRAGATHIVSADTAFDVMTEIGRLDPMRVEEWRTDVIAS